MCLYVSMGLSSLMLFSMGSVLVLVISLEAEAETTCILLFRVWLVMRLSGQGRVEQSNSYVKADLYHNQGDWMYLSNQSIKSINQG